MALEKLWVLYFTLGRFVGPGLRPIDLAGLYGRLARSPSHFLAPEHRFARYETEGFRVALEVISLRDLARYVDPEKRPADPLAVMQRRAKQLPQPSGSP